MQTSISFNSYAELLLYISLLGKCPVCPQSPLSPYLLSMLILMLMAEYVISGLAAAEDIAVSMHVLA